MEISYRFMTSGDWADVCEIYRQGIESGTATFQQEVPAWEQWDKSHHAHCRILAVSGVEIVGWAALSPVSMRAVYAGVAEVSIYVASKHQGKKIGHQLLERLVNESEKENIWTLQASIFPENASSLKIHYSAGFRQVGIREKIGKTKTKWQDTMLLERRSEHIGNE